MTLQPEDQQSIYTRIRDAIAATSPITNWSRNSPEKAISDDGFAAEMRERQHEALYVQLSARVDYAGRGTDDSEDPIDADDLEDLGLLNPGDVDLLNSYVEKSDLDAFATRNSITRDPGSFATGTVTFQTTSDSVIVPKGTTVTTPPDSEGETIDFETTEEVTPAANTTEVDAAIEAVGEYEAIITVKGGTEVPANTDITEVGVLAGGGGGGGILVYVDEFNAVTVEDGHTEEFTIPVDPSR